MEETLSARWTSWLEAHHAQIATSTASLNCESLPLDFVDRLVRKELSAEGCSQRQLLTHLALDLEPLEWSASSTSNMGERPCTFSQDCKVYLWPADSGYRCNHGQCVSAGGHPSGWVDATIPKDCDKGGYMDCDCKYVLYRVLFID